MVEVYDNTEVKAPSISECMEGGSFNNKKYDSLIEQYIKNTQEYLNKLKFRTKERGMLFKTPCADSYAYYMIISLDEKKCRLVKLDLWDCWDDPMVRHLTPAYIKAAMFKFGELAL